MVRSWRRLGFELDLDRKVATVGELVAFAEEKNPTNKLYC